MTLSPRLVDNNMFRLSLISSSFETMFTVPDSSSNAGGNAQPVPRNELNDWLICIFCLQFLLAPYLYRWKARHNDSAMRGSISLSCSRSSTYKHCHRSFDDRVRWPYTNNQVP